MFQNRSLSLILFVFAGWVVFINLDAIKEATQQTNPDGLPLKFYIFAEGKRIKNKAEPRQMLTFKVKSTENLFAGLFSTDGEGSPYLNADIMEIKAGETKPFTIKERERGILMPQQKTTFGVFYAPTEQEVTQASKVDHWENFQIVKTIELK